ncbi:MAG: hypothetical protein KF830_13870, partial [Planctomycetes bacterium]|nr:hypothetical protein [Planctomycetota bacterium]
ALTFLFPFPEASRSGQFEATCEASGKGGATCADDRAAPAVPRLGVLRPRTVSFASQSYPHAFLMRPRS